MNSPDDSSYGLGNVILTTLDCHKTCSTCTGPGLAHCLTCYQGNTLNSASGECITGCPVNQYYHKLNYQCYVTCPSGYVGDVASKTCVEGLTCHSECATCSGAKNSQCLTCTGSRYLLGTYCVTSCGEGKYAKSSPNACDNCYDTCLTCNGAAENNCLSCPSGYFISSGRCVTSCPTGSYGDCPTKSCLTCHSNCASCDNGGMYNCLTCATPYWMHDNQCKAACPLGWYGDATRICKTCSTACKEF
jgi:proprotein convertase subtilisin/kexin type 5